MTKLEAISLIAKEVKNKQGCKATELAICKSLIDVFKEYGVEIIDEAVEQKVICEVVYCLPDFSYRLKSFLLPVGTVLNEANNFANGK